MARPMKSITKRQQHWLDHIKVAKAGASALAAYAATHKPKVKYLYQWQTALNRRGFLLEKMPQVAFVPVVTAPSKTSSSSCNVTLPNDVCVQFNVASH